MEDITAQDILSHTPNEVVDIIKSRHTGADFEAYRKQFDPKQHAIHDGAKRPNKIKKTEQGAQQVPVSRLSVPLQKIVVSRASAFLIGEGITLKASANDDTQKQHLQLIKDTWHDNKLDYKTRQMARTWMSETEVAEYWFIKDDQIRMGIWANSYGDVLYPYFDEYGDMIAFGRGYQVGGRDFLDVYTAERIIIYAKYTNWEVDRDEANPWGKIPVVYYNREYPEWHDVQEMIERLETLISNFADTNDYFASPIVKIRGRVSGFADKGESGKMITMEENADASYLTWDQAPEAIRLEKETLLELIYAMTQTPDISFEKMKGIGNITGIALRLMFMDAKLKSLQHQEEFGEGLQRRINLIKKGLSVVHGREVEIAVEPQFNFYMPENQKELVDTLVAATGNRAILSRDTALLNNPFVVDAEAEKDRIEDDDAGEFGNIIP